MSSTFVRRHTVAATTNSAGSVTVYTPSVTGRVLQIRYVKTDFTDGVDLAATLETSGLAVLTVSNMNATATYVPKQQAHKWSDGTALTYPKGYEGGEEALITDYVYVANERIALAVTSGGASKTGTFYVWVG